MDPHDENYLSISSYSYVDNNPMIFIDPDGRDINFYIWVQKSDTEWDRQRVQFSQLDENLQKALESFAKTDEGFSFLSQFAKAGNMVGSVEFTEDGIRVTFPDSYAITVGHEAFLHLDQDMH